MVRRNRRAPKAKRATTKSVQALVRKELRKKVELKNNVVISGASGIGVSSTARAINPLDYIQEGTTSNERDGDSIYLTGHSFRTQIEGADSPFNRMRLSLVQTRDPLPLGLTSTDYVAGTCFDPVYSSMGMNAPFDRAVVSRVYFDKVFNLQRNVDGIGLTGRDVIRTFNKFVKNHQKVIYKNNSTALGTTTNHIYFVYQSDSAIAPNPTLTYVMKSWYTDQ